MVSKPQTTGSWKAFSGHIIGHSDFFITSALNQHLVLNRMNTPVQAQTQHAVQLCRVLTDTSQQQLYSKQNRENGSERDARRLPTLLPVNGCCRNTVWMLRHPAATSTSCPLICIINLTINIPRLLVNSLLTLLCNTWPSTINSEMCEDKVGSGRWEHRAGGSLRSN